MTTAANRPQLRHGSPIMVDYTPGSAVTAGDVVVQSNIPMICHTDIAANRKGALAIAGGVYQALGDAAIAVGDEVFWDATNEYVSETEAGNKRLGFCVVACTGAAAEVWFLHWPDVSNVEQTKAANVILLNVTDVRTLTRSESGSVIVNTTSGDATVVLPQAALIGDYFEFVCGEAGSSLGLIVNPGAAGAIYVNGAKQADDKHISASDEGSSVKLVADGNGDWYAIYATGTWGVEA